jgi:hypothetical protein
MPAIYLFQKRTLLGGDDLQVPALLTILARAVQGTLFVIPQCYYLIREAAAAAATAASSSGSSSAATSSTNFLLEFLLIDPNDIHSEYCRHSHFFPLLMSMYLLASTLFGLVSISLEYRLWWWSGQGTPTVHRQPRTSKVEGLLECKLYVFSVLLALILATYFSSMVYCHDFLQCRLDLEEEQFGAVDIDDGTGDIEYSNNYAPHWIGSKSWWLASVLLVMSQLTEVLLAVAFWTRLVHVNDLQTEQLLMDPSNSSSAAAAAAASSTIHYDTTHELTEELWADRCQWMCQCLSMSTCFIFGGQDFMENSTPNGVPYYKQLSQALADYLETRGTLDVVPTDLVTGLLVLQRLQRQRILQSRLQVVRSSQTQLQPLMQRVVAPEDDTSRRNLNNAVDGGYGMDDVNDPTSSSTSKSTSMSTSSATANGNHRHLLSRSISDVPSMNKDRPTHSTLRSRVGSTNDLRRITTVAANNATNTTGTTSLGVSSSMNGSASSSSSLDLPETTRLVNHHTASPIIKTGPFSPIIPTTQSIYRRIDRGEESHSSPRGRSPLHTTTTTSSPTTMSSALPFYQTQTRAVLNPHSPMDLLRLQEGARMAKYALSIYTWMLYLFVHPVTGIPRLVCRSCHLCQRCSHHRAASMMMDVMEHHDSTIPTGTGASLVRDSRGTIIGDNLCGWHKQSLLLVAGIPEADLVYAQFFNRFSLVPYCILLDHASQSVVVSVRGSLSLDDLVTDVHIDPECVYDLGQEHGFEADRNQYCHAGVVASARNVYADLERHGLLEQLLRNDYPEYHLRLAGHSLGAGICTLLGYMLQSRFPSLQVFNFSPPGCTMTWELATQCESWATTYILDSDIVPRLSVLALERLRDEVLELVGRLKVPKYQVVESFWTGHSRRACCWGASTDNASQDLEDLNELIDDWLFEVEAEDDPATTSFGSSGSSSAPYYTTTYYQQLKEYWRIQDERKQSRGSTRSIRLYPPGRMIHLLKTGEEGGCGHVAKKVATCCTSNSGFQYTPVYIANDDFDEILVSPTMATDHFVDRMFDELSNLAKTYEETSCSGEGSGIYFSSGDVV